MNINGLTLSGVTVGGKWVWTCPHRLDLAALHSGKTDSTPMIEAFTSWALLSTVTIVEGGNQ